MMLHNPLSDYVVVVDVFVIVITVDAVVVVGAAAADLLSVPKSDNSEPWTGRVC